MGQLLHTASRYLQNDVPWRKQVGGCGFEFFLPKSKFKIQEITYYFSFEAYFCPLRLFKGCHRLDTCCCREDQAGSGISCFIPYIFFHLPISFTPPPQEKRKKTQPNPNRKSFVFVSMGIL